MRSSKVGQGLGLLLTLEKVHRVFSQIWFNYSMMNKKSIETGSEWLNVNLGDITN